MYLSILSSFQRKTWLKKMKNLCWTILWHFSLQVSLCCFSFDVWNAAGSSFVASDEAHSTEECVLFSVLHNVATVVCEFVSCCCVLQFNVNCRASWYHRSNTCSLSMDKTVLSYPEGLHNICTHTLCHTTLVPVLLTVCLKCKKNKTYLLLFSILTGTITFANE